MNHHGARFWRADGEGAEVRCLACARECRVPPGGSGYCGVRRNVKGRLVLPGWGRLSTLNLSPAEIKPFYHFHPGSLWLSLGSWGCNFLCPGCQNWSVSHASAPEDIQPVPPERLARLAVECDSAGLSFTYNEPTVWAEYAVSAAGAAREQGLMSNLVTNGFMSKAVAEEFARVLDAVRVDVKAFTRESYGAVANVSEFRPVLANCELFLERGLHVEIVTNVVPGLSDSEEDMRGIARWIAGSLSRETPWHLTRFHPHLKLSHLPPTPVKTLERGRELGLEEGLEYVYVGNVPGHPAGHTCCPECRARLIVRGGCSTVEVNLAGRSCPQCGREIPIKGEARVTPPENKVPMRMLRS